MAKSKEFTFEVVEHMCKLGATSEKGWTTELNMVSWNGEPAKADIRAWNEDHTKMGKGITLTEKQLEDLREYLCGM